MCVQMPSALGHSEKPQGRWNRGPFWLGWGKRDMSRDVTDMAAFELGFQGHDCGDRRQKSAPGRAAERGGARKQHAQFCSRKAT